jgi:hypothetical protein
MSWIGVALSLLLVCAISKPAVRSDAADDHPLTQISELYADASHSTLFEHLQLLVEEAARRHNALSADSDVRAQHFAGVLASDVRYVHHGRGMCTGIEQVVGCLLREYEEENDEAPHRQRIETLVHGALHAVRELTERRRDSGTVKQLDVWFVRTAQLASGEHRIVLIERMPSVRDPLLTNL